MLTIGKRVYWIGSDKLCWGEVVARTATMDSDGTPHQLVVANDDGFRIFSSHHSWERFYETPTEAVNRHIEEMLKDAIRRQKVSSELYKALKEVPPEPENA